MGVLYLLIVAFLFSFGGTCAKTIAPYFSSEYISFFRFLFGVFFLFLLKLLTRHRFAPNFREQLKRFRPWLLMGGVGKEISYLCENYALTHGLSYGNILTQPAQLLFITFVSVVFMREKLSKQRAFFILPCILGVLVVSWNGRPFEDYLQGNLLLTVLFVLSGFFAGVHVLAQKKLAGEMHIIDSNLAMFSISLLTAVFPIIGPTASGAISGVQPSLSCIGAMMFFGFITGIGFYFNARAIPLVPLYLVPVIQSTMVIFSILWGVLFFHEPVTPYLIGGSIMFTIGIIGIQTAGLIKKKKQ